MDDVACREALRQQAWEVADGACQACSTAAGPAGRFCSGQSRWVEARRDESGGLLGLRRLEEARRDLSFDLSSLLADPALSWTVRAEASLLLADRSGSAATLELLPVPPDTAPADVVQRLALARARALAEAGLWSEARQAEQALAPAGDRLSPVQEIAVRRARAHRARWAAALALSPLVGLPWAGKAWRIRAGRPLGLVPLGALLVGTWLLVEGRSEGAGAALPLAAGGLVPLHLLGAGLLVTCPRWAVGLVRLWLALASLAVVWLAFHLSGTLHQLPS